jgi:hypothetical protein
MVVGVLMLKEVRIVNKMEMMSNVSVLNQKKHKKHVMLMKQEERMENIHHWLIKNSLY